MNTKHTVCHLLPKPKRKTIKHEPKNLLLLLLFSNVEIFMRVSSKFGHEHRTA